SASHAGSSPCLVPPLPSSPPFPYTTLFRSKIVSDYGVKSMFSSPTAIRVLKKQDPTYMRAHDTSTLRRLFLAGEPLDEPTARMRSEEHTSELQSPDHLVCRLLLEKKKKQTT